MAVSLAFGVLFATTITLYLIPCALLIGDDIGRGISAFRHWYLAPFSRRNTVAAVADQAAAERPEEVSIR